MNDLQLGAERRITLYYLLPALLLPFFSTLIYFVLMAGNPLAQFLYAATKVFMLAWPLICLLVFEQKFLLRKASGTTPLHRAGATGAVALIKSFAQAGRLRTRAARVLHTLPLGLLTGAAMSLFILFLFFFTPLGDYTAQNSGRIREHLLRMQVLGQPLLEIYLPASVFICLVNSLLEEYYWRWFVVGRLQKIIAAKYAIMLGSAAFAAHHYVILGCYFSAFGTVLFGTGVGIGGAIWCWQFSRQHSLIGVWVSHLLVDATFLWIGWKVLGV